MSKRGRQGKKRRFVGDFETTVFDGQTYTEVWASALVEIGSEEVEIYHSIGETFDRLVELSENGSIIVYYHNLKFDGSFWLDYLLVQKEFKQALLKYGDDGNILPEDTPDHLVKSVEWIKLAAEMPNKSVKYVIANTGEWYVIYIKIGRHTIELRDSLKLIPMSVKMIGGPKGFNTKHKKLDMEYTGLRYAGCNITDEEKEYIKNDVLVVKEALEIMFSKGHNLMTIGSCCLDEYKMILDNRLYRDWFPDLTTWPLPEIYGAKTVDEYIRKSYHGGWCFVVPEKAGKVFINGLTFDVNSLYPSVMHSESGSKYPIGIPEFWSGNYIPAEACNPGRYFFIRIRTRFYIKKNMLPFVQVKNDWRHYRPTENLTTSDVYDPLSKEFTPYYTDADGHIKAAVLELTFTQTDFNRFLDHYNIIDFEILDGCYFYAVKGLFDEYIDKYRRLKINAETAAFRTISKLFLNNLYGKMAAGTDSSFKYAYVRNDEKQIDFLYQRESKKKPGFIPVGSAITSYARDFTIRAAQKNYYGPDKPGFIYADTDSIHCDIKPEKVRGIKTDPVNFNCWKLESKWDQGIFVRQKTYIEHIVEDDKGPVKKPTYTVKCAGLPLRCKKMLVHSIEGTRPPDDDPDIPYHKLDADELNFISEKRDITNFELGMTIPGKLLPRRIPGGIVLEKTTFKLI